MIETDLSIASSISQRAESKAIPRTLVTFGIFLEALTLAIAVNVQNKLSESDSIFRHSSYSTLLNVAKVDLRNSTYRIRLVTFSISQRAESNAIVWTLVAFGIFLEAFTLTVEVKVQN